MRSRARGDGEGGETAGTRAAGQAGAGALGGAIDQLYAAPLDGFIALRKKLVAELRAAGDRPSAQTVSTVAKPSRTTWALNQVARTKPELVQGTLDARAAAAGAPKAGDVEQMRATAKAFRDRVNDVVQAAMAVMRQAGAELTPAQGRTIGETLQAIASGDDDQRAALLAGRLAEDVAVDDPFAGIDVGERKPREATTHAAAATHTEPATHAAHGKPDPAKTPPDRAALHAVPKAPPAEDPHAEAHRARDAKAREAQAKAREEAARQAREQAAREARERALAAARAHVTALEDRAKEARAAARVAEVAAHRAQADAERLRRAATDLDKELAEAKAALRSQG